MSESLLDTYPHRMGGHCGSSAMRDLMVRGTRLVVQSLCDFRLMGRGPL